MNDRIEKAFRTLAASARGPFRVIAYGLASGETGEQIRELGSLLDQEKLAGETIVVVEETNPYVAAVGRPRFRAEVLGRLEGEKGPRLKEISVIEGRGAPARARERLSVLSSRLPDVLDQVDRKLARLQAGGASSNEGPMEEAEVAPPAEASAAADAASDAEASWLILVRCLEDLGSDAEAIAGAARRIVATGAHLVVHQEGIDTRTREGRALTRFTIRLGMLKATRSRERAVQETARRRNGLRVYGPVPFGFTKLGEELRPVAEQLATVRRIRELAKLDQTPVTIAITLNRERRFWKDGSAWTWRRVSQVLKNAVYDRALSETAP